MMKMLCLIGCVMVALGSSAQSATRATPASKTDAADVAPLRLAPRKPATEQKAETETIVTKPAVAEKTATAKAAAEKDATEKKDQPAKEQLAVKNTKITADKMEYNYKEAVAIMTDNVVVTDPEFRLDADKLFVFFDGTNKLSQLVVVGHVVVSNANRTATCDRAVFTQAENMLVMVGNAALNNTDEEGKVSSVKGDKITIWTKDERMEVYPRPTLVLPAGMGAGDGPSALLK